MHHFNAFHRKSVKNPTMRQIITTLLITLILCSSGIFTLTSTGCSKPAWLTDATNAFKNGRFVPELQEVFPGALINTDSSSIASTSFIPDILGSSYDATFTNSSDPTVKTLLFSDLKGNYSDNNETYLLTVTFLRERLDGLKNTVMNGFESSNISTQGVWVKDLKYEETEAGDRFIYMRYTYTQSASGSTSTGQRKISAGTKLSMYAKGTNETYHFANYPDGTPQLRLYASYKENERFIYLSSYNDEYGQTFSCTSFSLGGSTKTGVLVDSYVSADSNSKGFSINEFSGNNNYVSINSYSEGKDGSYTDRYQSAYSIIDGIIYGDSYLDLRAFTNIEEIYYSYAVFDDNRPYVVGLKLTDSTIINISTMWASFRMYDAMEFREVAGIIQLVPVGGFNIKAVLNNYVSEKPTEAVPFPQMKLPASVDQIYANLKSGSVGYFDNYYLTSFTPLASIRLNFANMPTFENTMLNYIQTHHAGF